MLAGGWWSLAVPVDGQASASLWGWADLPPELLLLILDKELEWERSTSLAVRSVCQGWRRAHDSALSSVYASTWSLPLRFPALQSLEVLSCSALTDKGLRHAVKRLSTVSSLSLSGCGAELTQVGVKALRRLSLSSLHLGLCRLNTPTARALGRLTALNSLTLDRATLTRARVWELAKLSSLRSLVLNDCVEGIDDYGDDDECLEQLLSSLTGLQTLGITGSFLGPSDLEAIGGLSQLQSLDLRGAEMDVDDPEEDTQLSDMLTSLTSLTELKLSGVYLSFEAMSVLASRFSLTVLSLAGCDWFQDGGDMDDSLVIALSGMPKLTTLDLSDGGTLMLESMEALRSHRALTSLTLRNCEFAVDEEDGDDDFLDGLYSLTSLDLDGCGLLSPQRMTCLGRLKKLRSLSLNGKLSHSHTRCSCGECLDTDYTYDGQEGDILGGVLSKLTALTQLSLTDYTLSVRTVVSLRRLNSLASLHLHKCALEPEESNLLGDKDMLTSLLHTLPSLRTLSLRGNCCSPAAADNAMRSLSKLTRLTAMDLRGFGFLIDTHMRALHGLRVLRTLHVVCGKQASTLAVQDMVAKMPALTSLHLRMHSLSDGEVLVMSRSLPKVLTSLTMQLNIKLTDAGLLPLATMPALRSVTLVKDAPAAQPKPLTVLPSPDKVTDAGLSALRHAPRGLWPVVLGPSDSAAPPPLVVTRVSSSSLE